MKTIFNLNPFAGGDTRQGKAAEVTLWSKGKPGRHLHKTCRYFLGRLRLDALRLLWEMESGGTRARLINEGTAVIEDDDEA